MKPLRSVVAGLVMAAGVAATLPLGTGTAAAVDKVACFAPNGQYCVAFDMRKGTDNKSARINGACQTGPFHEGRRTHYPYTFVDVSRPVSVMFLVSDVNCGGRGSVSFTVYPPRSNAANRWGIDGRWAIVSE